jgi:hypothetical protein
MAAGCSAPARSLPAVAPESQSTNDIERSRILIKPSEGAEQGRQKYGTAFSNNGGRFRTRHKHWNLDLDQSDP